MNGENMLFISVVSMRTSKERSGKALWKRGHLKWILRMQKIHFMKLRVDAEE